MSKPGITQADIARMAGVGRAAVSNWRSRYPDFPQPIGGTQRGPEFDHDAVAQWISNHQASHTTQVALPPATGTAPPPLAEPLFALLRKAHTRKAGVWLLHEEIVDNGMATAPLIRKLAANGAIERNTASFSFGHRVLLRLPHTDETVDVRDVERQANAALALVGHHVIINPARDAGGRYTPVKITHRGKTYTGYLLSRPWTVRVALNNQSKTRP